MVSIMKTRTQCNEDTKICLDKFRCFIEMITSQLELQTCRKQVGECEKIFQAKDLHMQSQFPEKNYNDFFSILFVNIYVWVSIPLQWHCLNLSIFRGKRLQKIYLHVIHS